MGHYSAVRRAFAVLALLASAMPALAAFEIRFDRLLLEAALSIGQSRVPTVHTRFHEPYRIKVSAAPVDFVEIVTPFRKVVLAAESAQRTGGSLYGLRAAQETAGAGNDAAVYVELTFHPHNTFVGVPDYKVALRHDESDVSPASIERIPRSGPRVEGIPSISPPVPGGLIRPKGSQPVTGGTLIAHFATGTLNPQGTYDVRVLDGASVLATARVDFAKLR